MADVALRPTFPQAELDRLRQERLTALIQARDDAAQVAPMAFARVVFGGTHRYGTAAHGHGGHAEGVHDVGPARVPLGDVSTVERDAGRRRRRQRRRRAAAPREALRRLEGRRRGHAYAGAAVRRSSTERQVTIVDMPGAEQSQVRIGWVGVPRSTPDYFTLQVLNTILGGSFTSRLNQNLREKNQFTLRRQLAVRHAALRRAVLRRRGHPDRQDRPTRCASSSTS